MAGPQSGSRSTPTKSSTPPPARIGPTSTPSIDASGFAARTLAMIRS